MGMGTYQVSGDRILRDIKMNEIMPHPSELKIGLNRYTANQITKKRSLEVVQKVLQENTEKYTM